VTITVRLARPAEARDVAQYNELAFDLGPILEALQPRRPARRARPRKPPNLIRHRITTRQMPVPLVSARCRVSLNVKVPEARAWSGTGTHVRGVGEFRGRLDGDPGHLAQAAVRGVHRSDDRGCCPERRRGAPATGANGGGGSFAASPTP